MNSRAKKLVVFGGNGYVGQHVITQALAIFPNNDITIVSINRSGKPLHYVPALQQRLSLNSKPISDVGNQEITKGVIWHKGDIMNPKEWEDVLKESDGVISCVGAFGSNEFMERINGDANIIAINSAKHAGVPRFTYVSTVENNLPKFILSGYFNGKRRAEAELHRVYGSHGYVLRPSFVYGTRVVTIPKINVPVSLPLGWIGKPMDFLFSNSFVESLSNIIPGMKAILTAPVSVDDVAKAAVITALGLHEANGTSESPDSTMISVRKIKELAGQ